MRIDGLIENTLKNSRLKRVRIKVDPSQLAPFGYEHVTSFEGYVLEENNTTVQVYLLNLPDQFEPVQTVDKKFVNPSLANTINPSVQNFKKKILSVLEKDKVPIDNPDYQNILKSNEGEFIEGYLKNLGYDGVKLQDLYKQAALNEASQTAEKAIDAASRAMNAITYIPRLVAGKKNIIGRVGRFIRSLNVNDLFDVDKYGPAKSKDFPNSIKEGDTVFINNLPYEALKKFKYGNIVYQARGITTKGLFDEQRKLHKIINVDPVQLDREIDFSLDFSILGNPNKTGTLIMDFLKEKEPTKYFTVKVEDYQDNKIITVLKEIPEKEGKIGYQIKQEQVRKAVKTALEEYFGDTPASNMGELINKISDKILPNKEQNLVLFDKTMQILMSRPEAKKTGKPEVDLTRALKSEGLI